MPEIFDIFKGDGFGLVSMTQAINRLEPQYGLLQSRGLFREVGVATDTVVLEDRGDSLFLLPTVARGGEPTLGSSPKRKLYPVLIPHNPHEDSVLPSDVLGRRAFGTADQLETVMTRVAEKLGYMRRKHEITREFRQWKALEGKVLDADGSEMLDIFDLLGKTRKVVDFVLGTAGTNIRAKIEEILDHQAEEAEGETLTGATAYCGATFWEKLTSHAKVEKAWEFWNGRSNMLGEDQRGGFPFGGITWMKHIGKATAKDAAGATTVRKFIPDGDAIIVPEGTNDTFLAYNAPGDFSDAIGELGLPFYARTEVRKYNKGMDVYTESNHMPIVTRPQLVVRAHSSN